jgi:flavodoxin/NAD-dependent dihydropyrimidine dehydrogenase PreA subunit
MKIGIAVFSGTGNTAYVAELLGKELRSLGATVDIQQIDSTSFHVMDADTIDFDPSCYDLIGIGHPILGFGAPPLVLRFAEALPNGWGRMFIFKSAADNHRINNAASEKLIKVLADKGYEVIHDFLYIMPCNWIMNYQRCFNLQIIDKAKEKVVFHARELITGTRSLMPVYQGWRQIGRILHYLETNYGRKQFGKALRVTNDCTLCGDCIRNCPAKNIREENQVVRFGENCLWCMRCVYNCQAKAIDAQWMKWCIIEGGYQLNDYVEASDICRNFITRKSRGYWKHFQEYFL